MTAPRNAQTKQSKHFYKRKAALRAQYRKAIETKTQAENFLKSLLQENKSKKPSHNNQRNNTKKPYGNKKQSDRYPGLGYDLNEQGSARPERNWYNLSGWFVPATKCDTHTKPILVEAGVRRTCPLAAESIKAWLASYNTDSKTSSV
jgi:hypothetical protein